MATENRKLHGVSLRQYAAVLVGLTEGFPIEVVLACERVSNGVWPRADEAWARCLAEEDADASLQRELDGSLGDARRRYGRRIDPLDDDLRAWLDFIRRFSAEAEPMNYLGKVGLTHGDLLRLHQMWSARLSDDPAAQRRAETILAVEPGEPCEIVVAGRQPPPPLALAEAADSQSMDSTMEEEREAPVDPPPLFVQLPAPTASTPKASPPPRKFVANEAAAAPAMQAEEELGEGTLVEEPSLTIDAYAAIAAERALEPDKAASVLARHGITDADYVALEKQYLEAFNKDPLLRRDYRSLFAHHDRRLRASANAPPPPQQSPVHPQNNSPSPALPLPNPIAGAGAVVPPPAPVALTKKDLARTSLGVDIPRQALPFAKKDSSLGEGSWKAPPPSVIAREGGVAPPGKNKMKATMMAVDIPKTAVLPFDVQKPTPTSAPTPPPAAPKRGLAETSFELSAARDALPFRGAGTPASPAGTDGNAAAGSGGMTLEQYASLCAELSVAKGKHDEIRKRYGIADERAWQALDANWQARFLSDPAARTKWLELAEQYRRWLVRPR